MEEQNLNEMLLVRRQKLQELVDSGKDPHEIEKFEGTIYAKEIKDNYENYEGKVVRLAGRIRTKEDMVKFVLWICKIFPKDSTFNKLDVLGESYEEVKTLILEIL